MIMDNNNNIYTRLDGVCYTSQGHVLNVKFQKLKVIIPYLLLSTHI